MMKSGPVWSMFGCVYLSMGLTFFSHALASQLNSAKGAAPEIIYDGTGSVIHEWHVAAGFVYTTLAVSMPLLATYYDRMARRLEKQRNEEEA